MATNKTNTSKQSYFERLETEIRSSQSALSLVLGALIVIVVGVLVFNYFNKNNNQNADLGPAQKTEDVSPANLPGKYTVKDGDTLFIIADKYYKDGYKFDQIAKANNLTDENKIAAGQVLEIPKLEDTTALATETPSPTVSQDQVNGTGGASNQTIWGETITNDTYTVVAGDWLSTIAGRAYNGDVMAFNKIAQANSISDPNVIEPGMVLKIPR